MDDFLRFFEEKRCYLPMHLEIYYSKICDWVIHIWRELDEAVDIFHESDSDVELLFAKAHVGLKEWLLKNEGGY